MALSWLLQLGLFTNQWIWIGISVMALVTLIFTYLPLMNTLFHTAPIGLIDWVRIFGVGFVIYFAVSLDKKIRRRSDVSSA